MPCIPRQYFENTLRHSQILFEHGQRFEQMAVRLGDRLLTESEAFLIRDAGQQVRRQAEVMRAIAERTLQNKDSDCIEECKQICQSQRQALSQYAKVAQILIEAIKDSIPAQLSLRPASDLDGCNLGHTFPRQ